MVSCTEDGRSEERVEGVDELDVVCGSGTKVKNVYDFIGED